MVLELAILPNKSKEGCVVIMGIGVGIYGSNGHQISQSMIERENAYLAGVCGINTDNISPQIPVYASFEEMLKADNIKLVSICSSSRREQAEAIILALKANKHVYAEKPCVMDIEQLDYILQLAEQKNLIFCEMAGTAFERPYYKVKEIVESGVLGQIVQIFAQKSYPYGDWRPQNEDIDGGLIMQNAIYGIRFIEHLAGQKVVTIDAMETTLGNPKNGGLRMAAVLNMKLETNGIATVIANYLNQPGTNIWGNEELRIFGVNGYLRTNILNNTVEVYTKDDAIVYETVPVNSLFQILINCIACNKPLPMSAYELTHPTRLAIKAKQKADSLM